MKTSKFSDAKGVHFEAGAGGMLIANIRRKAGISQATRFNWKNRHDGLAVDRDAAERKW